MLLQKKHAVRTVLSFARSCSKTSQKGFASQCPKCGAGDAAQQEEEPLSEQDTFYTASEGVDEDEDGDDGAARLWDSSCPQAFPWDGKSSLMVCVCPEQKIWYQAHVVKQRSNHYLLSWSGQSPVAHSDSLSDPDSLQMSALRC